MTDGQPWKLKVSIYLYGRTKKLYVTVSCCHSSSLPYLLPCLAFKLQIHLGKRLAALSYVCISPNT